MHYQQHVQSSHYPATTNTVNQYEQYQNNYAYAHQSPENIYSQNRSPSMPVYNETGSQMNVNNSYMPNHLHGNRQPNVYGSLETATHRAQVPPAINNLQSSQLPNVDNSTDESDSPLLRSILKDKSGRKLRPNYYLSTRENNYGTISPVRTEESLEYLDDLTLEQQLPITGKSGYEHAALSLEMNCENLNASSSIPSASSTPLTNPSVSSPITSYGISTPPQSPKKAAIEHVNQTSCDASTGADNRAWTQNGSDCKFRILYLFSTLLLFPFISTTCTVDKPTSLFVFILIFITNIFIIFSTFQVLSVERNAHVKPTLVNKRSNWRKSLIVIVTWRVEGVLKFPTRWNWPRDKSRFGFKIDVWKRRNRTCHRWARVLSIAILNSTKFPAITRIWAISTHQTFNSTRNNSIKFLRIINTWATLRQLWCRMATKFLHLHNPIRIYTTTTTTCITRHQPAM